MARESEAERSLRELQEGMAAREDDRERPVRPSSGGTTTTTRPATATPARKRPVGPLVVLGAVVLAGAAVAAVLVVLAVGGDGTSTGIEGRATSFAEADEVQTARGREAQRRVYGLGYPSSFQERGGAAEVSMKVNGNTSYAFYDTVYDIGRADYTGDQFQTWFYREAARAVPDPDDLSCTITGAGSEVSCEVAFEDGDTSDGTTRQTVTLTFEASPEDGPAPVMSARGYSTQY